MLALIYADLPPNDKKMSRQQIDSQVSLNQPMRIRMTYARLVMIHYYKNKQDNDSQWTAINDRLRVLRASSKEFQQVTIPSSPNFSHAQLVMDKDDQLFSHKRHINQITKDECVVPTLDDVRAAMAAGMVELADGKLLYTCYWSPNKSLSTTSFCVLVTAIPTRACRRQAPVYTLLTSRRKLADDQDTVG
ncbi:hypothetical protein PGT21_035358 [Puccinia graminis f. sp. tritici]|uniref:Uncharacterized protein n=1 Tax=Puccinia graminis f. sp. tritici TaxID=56615 RepID=A0A5B0PZU7_PUCGR|nr:hypothetical protein PGT21_035358 [Puccinia graminis f. sp. tritici]